jgi:hypothetical protein
VQKTLTRIATFLLVVLAIVAAAPSLSSGTFSTTSWAASGATADYELNASTTDNVYQQIVVAGWGTRDMLEVIANQTGGIDVMAEAILASQQREAQLETIQIILLAFVIGLLTRFIPKRQKTPTASKDTATESTAAPVPA